MRTVEITGELWRSLNDKKIPKDKLKLRFIKPAFKPDKTSPVLLLGESHTLVFHTAELHASGAGLADQLSHELGFAIDLLGVRGSGSTPARIQLMFRGRRNPGYLTGKKLIIWCFTAREFTETNGWRKVALTKRAKKAKP